MTDNPGSRTSESTVPTPEEYAFLIDNLRDHAFIILNATGAITTWNAGAKRLYGFDANEIIGKPMSSLYADEQGDLHMNTQLAEVTGHASASYDSWHLRKDGTRFWAKTEFKSLLDTERR